jgi:uncharacterized protein YkwD
MPKRRVTLPVAGLALGCALTPTTPAAAAPAATAEDRVERAIVQEVNDLRARHGVRRLQRSVALKRAADVKVREVLLTNVLTHASPDGTSMRARVRRFVSARAVAETLGYVPVRSRQASRIVRVWMRSPAHRRTLLSRSYRRVGVRRVAGRLGSSRVTVVALDLASAR